MWRRREAWIGYQVGVHVRMGRKVSTIVHYRILVISPYDQLGVGNNRSLQVSNRRLYIVRTVE